MKVVRWLVWHPDNEVVYCSKVSASDAWWKAEVLERIYGCVASMQALGWRVSRIELDTESDDDR